MSSNEVPAAKFLIGLGIVGAVLNDGEKPVTDVRQALRTRGFTSYQISRIFSSLRDGHVRGVNVDIRTHHGAIYWNLRGSVFQDS